MFEILSESTETCIGVKVTGKVSGKDYEGFVAKVDETIVAQGKINMLLLVEDFQGPADLDAAKADFKFGTGQYRQVERCAFVGDKGWYKWVVKLLDPFTRRTDEKLFEPSQLQEAWNWACGQD